jgi:hypothetical protein
MGKWLLDSPNCPHLCCYLCMYFMYAICLSIARILCMFNQVLICYDCQYAVAKIWLYMIHLMWVHSSQKSHWIALWLDRFPFLQFVQGYLIGPGLMYTSPLNNIVIIIQHFGGLFIFLCSNCFFSGRQFWLWHP